MVGAASAKAGVRGWAGREEGGDYGGKIGNVEEN